MRRLKLRRQPDVMPNQPRGRSSGLTRWIYLLTLFGMFAWLADLLLGSYVYFRSDGIVLAPVVTLATEYPGTVRTLGIREGDQVQRDTPVMTLTSQHVTESIADLTTQLATRRARISELRVRAKTVGAMLQAAATRNQIATDARRQYDELVDKGMLPIDKRTAAIEAEYRSLYDVENLKAERDAITAELAVLEPVIDRAEAALQDLQGLYRKGRLLAPTDGVVGHLYVNVGSVAQPGEPLADLYGHNRHVIGFLPTGTLYEMQPGDKVVVRWGVRALTGRIQTIEPVAAALPKEFQKAFKPVEREQILRVQLDQTADMPPLFAKVRLRDAEIVPAMLHRLAHAVGL